MNLAVFCMGKMQASGLMKIILLIAPQLPRASILCFLSLSPPGCLTGMAVG